MQKDYYPKYFLICLYFQEYQQEESYFPSFSPFFPMMFGYCCYPIDIYLAKLIFLLFPATISILKD